MNHYSIFGSKMYSIYYHISLCKSRPPFEAAFEAAKKYHSQGPGVLQPLHPRYIRPSFCWKKLLSIYVGRTKGVAAREFCLLYALRERCFPRSYFPFQITYGFLRPIAYFLYFLSLFTATSNDIWSPKQYTLHEENYIILCSIGAYKCRSLFRYHLLGPLSFFVIFSYHSDYFFS